MDPLKKQALLGWVNALFPEQTVNNFYELLDGPQLLQIIKLSEESVQIGSSDSRHDILHKVKQFLEGFWNTAFEPTETSLIDFQHIQNAKASDEKFDLEISKILLCILGASVQEQKAEMFVQTATSLTEKLQFKIMEMIQPFFMETSSQLPEDLDDILTKSSAIPPRLSLNESSSSNQLDAALFFKLVSGRNLSMAESPTLEQSFHLPNHRAADCGVKGSPLPHLGPSMNHTSAGLGIRDIESPLRMMSLTGSPLGAFIQSPQFAQKALIRQKDREIHRLEQNLFHLSNDMEIDMKERRKEINEKDAKIKELENVLQDYRSLKNSVFELENIRLERDQLAEEFQKSQSKLQELQEANKYLETVNKEITKELSESRLECDTLECQTKNTTDWHVRCAELESRISEYECLLAERQSDIDQCRMQVQEALEAKNVLQNQKEELRRQKCELEEALAQCGEKDRSLGESMGFITEVKVGELQSELNTLRNTWIDPSTHNALQIELNNMVAQKDQYKVQYEESCVVVKGKNTEIENLRQTMTELENSLRAEINSLQQSNATLESQAREEQQVADDKLQRLMQDKCQQEEEFQARENNYHTELQKFQETNSCLQSDIENLKTESENRIMALVNNSHAQEKEWSEKMNHLQMNLSSLDDRYKHTCEELTNIKALLENTKCELQNSDNANDKLHIQLSASDTLNEELQKRIEAVLCDMEVEKSSHKKVLDKITAENEMALVEFKALLSSSEEEKQMALKEKDKQIQRLKANLSELERAKAEESSMNREKNDSLEKTLFDMQTEYENSLANISRLESEMGSLKQTATETERVLNEEIAKSKSETRAIAEELASMKEQYSQSVSECSSKDAKIAELDAEIKSLKCTAAEMEKSLQQQLANSQAEKESVSEQLSSMTEKHQASVSQYSLLQTKFVKLESEKDSIYRTAAQTESRMKQELTKIRSEKESVARQLVTVKEQYQASISQSSSMDTKISSLMQQLCDQEEKQQDLVGQLALVNRIAESKQMDNEQLQKELSQAKKDAEASQKVQECQAAEIGQKTKEIQQLQATLTQQAEEARQLQEAQTEEISCKAKEIQLLKKNVESLSSEHSELLGKLEELETQLVQEQENARTVQETQAGELGQKVEEISKLQAECERLSAQNEQEVNKLHSAELQIQKETGRANGLQDMLNRETENNQSAIQTLNGKIKSLTSELEKTGAALQEMETSLKQQAAEVAARQEKQAAEICDKNHEIQQLQSSLKSLTCEHEELLHRYSNIEVLMKSDAEKAKMLQESQIGELSQKQAEVEQLKENLRVLSEEKLKLVEHNQYLEQAVDEKDKAIEQLSSEYKELKAGKDQLQGAFEKEVTEHKSTILALEEKIVVLNKEIEDLQSVWGQKEKKWQESLGESESSAELATREVELLTKHKTEMEQNIVDVRQQLDLLNKVLEENKDSHQNQMESMETELVHKKNECEVLHEKLSVAQKENQAKKAELESLLSLKDSEISSQAASVQELRLSLEAEVQRSNQLMEEHKLKMSELVVNHNSEKTDLSSVLAELEQRVQETQTQVTEKERENADYQELIKDLESSLKCVEGNLKSVIQEANQKDQLLAERENKASEMQESLQQAEQQICKLQQKVTQLTEEFSFSSREQEVQYSEKTEKVTMELTNVRQELKETQAKSKKFEQLLVELQHQFDIQGDEKKKIKEMNDMKFAQLKSELEKSAANLKDTKAEASRVLQETEEYWKKQLSSQQGNYYQATEELKQQYQDLAVEHESRLRAEIESLQQEKEMKEAMLTNQKAAFQEHINNLESRLNQKFTEMEKLECRLLEEKSKAVENLKAEHRQQLQTIQQEIDSELQNSKDLETDLQDYKHRCQELENKLHDQKNHFESVLSRKCEDSHQQMSQAKEEYREKFAALEREKGRVLEEERAKRMAAEDKCLEIQKHIDVAVAEATSLKQQVAAIEQERDQILTDCEDKIQQNMAHMANFEKRDGQRQNVFETEIKECREKYQKKVAELMEKHRTREVEIQEEMSHMKEGYSKMETELKEVKAMLKQVEGRRDKLEQIRENYSKYYKEKKEELELQRKETGIYIKLSEEYKKEKENLLEEFESYKSRAKLDSEKHKKRMKEMETHLSSNDVTALKSKVQDEMQKTSTLTRENGELRTRLDNASHVIQKYRQQLEMVTNGMFTDNSDFMKLVKESDRHGVLAGSCGFLDKEMETPYNLRSKSKNSLLDNSLTMETDHKTVQNLDFRSDSSPESVAPTANDLGMELRNKSRRASVASSLNRSILSTDSAHSLAGIPKVGKMFSMEDEPVMDFEWDRVNRLNELKRRNTLCLPHLKSAYPVELQERNVEERTLRESRATPNALKNKKRKQNSSEEESDSSVPPEKLPRSKQARHHGTVYQKPGPPTPVNTHQMERRSSSSKLMTSTPPVHRGGIMRSRRTPKRSDNAENEHQQQLTRSTKKGPLSFSIGFTPLQKKSSRQAALKDNLQNSTTKVSRRPLGSKNYLQTGV